MEEQDRAKAGFLREGDLRPGELRPETNRKPPLGLFHRETAVSPGPSEIRPKNRENKGSDRRRRKTTPQEAF